MKRHTRVSLQKRIDLAGFVRRQIVQDDVNLLMRAAAGITCSRKPTNSALVRLLAVLPCTYPVFTPSAA
jgi:hypothetical protein